MFQKLNFVASFVVLVVLAANCQSVSAQSGSRGFSAPAPRFSAPAPQFSAPVVGGSGSRVVTQQFAPAQQFSAPAPVAGSGTRFAPAPSGSGSRIISSAPAPVYSSGPVYSSPAPVCSSGPIYSAPVQSFSVPYRGGGCGF